jgi:hypothetical protein
LEPQSNLEHLDRLERELSIEAAPDGIGLAESMLRQQRRTYDVSNRLADRPMATPEEE